MHQGENIKSGDNTSNEESLLLGEDACEYLSQYKDEYLIPFFDEFVRESSLVDGISSKKKFQEAVFCLEEVLNCKDIGGFRGSLIHIILTLGEDIFNEFHDRLEIIFNSCCDSDVDKEQDFEFQNMVQQCSQFSGLEEKDVIPRIVEYFHEEGKKYLSDKKLFISLSDSEFDNYGQTKVVELTPARVIPSSKNPSMVNDLVEEIKEANLQEDIANEGTPTTNIVSPNSAFRVLQANSRHK